jgi:hypothetical protein
MSTVIALACRGFRLLHLDLHLPAYSKHRLPAWSKGNKPLSVQIKS